MQWTLLLNFVLIDPMISEKNIKNRPCPFWHLWASCFFCVILIYKRNIPILENHAMNTPTKFCSDWLYDFREEQKFFFREPSNEHSYQLRFQLSQWFKILKIMDADDNKGSGELKMVQYSIHELHDKNVIDYNDRLRLCLESSKTVIEYWTFLFPWYIETLSMVS
jgi:hypothetical protein